LRSSSYRHVGGPAGPPKPEGRNYCIQPVIIAKRFEGQRISSKEERGRNPMPSFNEKCGVLQSSGGRDSRTKECAGSRTRNEKPGPAGLQPKIVEKGKIINFWPAHPNNARKEGFLLCETKEDRH